MKRLLLLVSGFLFVGFYQLSGGADFDPVAAREAAVLARMEEDAARRDAPAATVIAMLKNTTPAAVAEAAAPQRVSETTFAESKQNVEVVTRAAVDLSLLAIPEDAADATETVVDPAPQTVPAEAAPTKIAADFQAVEELVAATDKVIPSLIFEGNTTAANSVQVSAPRDAPAVRDLRVIDADRVNMRGGPGTGYEIVARFDRNAQLEVLEDSGTGWLRLRPVDGGPTGWIADFLLSDG